jgi:hypothetical protein
MKAFANIFFVITHLIVTSAFRGQLLQSVRLTSSNPQYLVSSRKIASRIARPEVRNFCEQGGDSMSGSTVVSRCIKKISDSLQPTECEVTSTDDDPNGSHVSNCTIILLAF